MNSGKPGKTRLDQALVDRGLVDSRSRAQALVMAGQVLVGDKRADKPGQPVRADQAVALKVQDHPYVSRGGLKLEAGLGAFGIDPAGLTCLDIGASTGGFTDVLLQRGARRVYAVDVGHGQLAWRLRQDDRVVVLERTNARHLTGDNLPELVDLIVCDASFIGLAKVLDVPLGFAAPGARLVALIKPQFEVGRDQVGKGGVVRDPALHQSACEAVRDWLAARSGWRVLGLADSPITGPEGNREFLIGAYYRP
jgi:23S rRNA (cytidine1920-2'-O)/16S rRNA (cytidine1409-2'-O)-methyltransferase